jgi:hypothetical protein
MAPNEGDNDPVDVRKELVRGVHPDHFRIDEFQYHHVRMVLVILISFIGNAEGVPPFSSGE